MKTILKIAASLMLVFCCVPIEAETVQTMKPEHPDYLNSVKITFLSWLTGSTKVSYERAFPKIRQSGEICGSLIYGGYAGYDKYKNDPLGFTVRYGHKFFLPDRDGRSLMGFYLRPELMYSRYTYTCTNTGLFGCRASGADGDTHGYHRLSICLQAFSGRLLVRRRVCGRTTG